ncbi:MAG: phage protease [Sandaracinobacter sp.]
MPQKRSPSTPAIAAAAAIEVRVAEGSPATRLQLMPLGAVELRDGRGPFRLDDAAAVIEATKRHAGQTHIVVDYDHQHFFGVKPGVAAQAPAAGWIDPASLRVEDDGIWGDVEWTAAAAEKLRAREYRYVSPLFAFDETSGAVLAILNASLTNVPAIEALAAAAGVEWAANSKGAASADLTPDPNATQETEQMLLAKIAAALGLADSATEEEVMLKLASLNQGAAGVAAATASIAAAAVKLGLSADATADQVAAAAVAKAEPDPAKFVPISAMTDLQTRLAALEGDKVAAVVAAAMEAGKVSPGQKDWAISYASKDLAAFEAYLKTAPVIVAPGAQLAAAAAQPGGDGLTESERQVAKMLGRTPEQMLAAKKAN